MSQTPRPFMKPDHQSRQIKKIYQKIRRIKHQKCSLLRIGGIQKRVKQPYRLNKPLNLKQIIKGGKQKRKSPS